jgi:hypothetical protein
MKIYQGSPLFLYSCLKQNYKNVFGNTKEFMYRFRTNIIDQAKAMEKDQIIEFVYDAVRKILDEDRQNPFNLEQYYNETYNK